MNIFVKKSMKKFYLILLLTSLFFCFEDLNSQISKGGIPFSIIYQLPDENVDKITLQPPSLELLRNLNKDKVKHRPPIIGYAIKTDISLNNSGEWTYLPDNRGKIWRLKVYAPGAIGLIMNYDKFYLPKGVKLFLYNKDKTQIIGAFDYENNHESKLFATEIIYGDETIIEMYIPNRVAGQIEFHINEVGYIFSDIAQKFKWTDPADTCEVNINCSPVGDAWQTVKRGVARIIVKAGFFYGYCTGSLINNTNQDCTPYFLTAYHCYEGASSQDLNQWIFYFNYESQTCQSPTVEPSSNTMTGATLKAYGSIQGGSDFVLLRLNQNVPQSYNPYMNGWSRLNSVEGPGACIHHPNGSIKKISTYNTATSATWSGGANNGYWRVVWTSNPNGWGVTEQGSSGSPLFDANKRIVGTLTGGSSYCDQKTNPDYFGKFYYHWDLNGSSSNNQLKPWLDPINSGVTTLDGKNCGSTSTLNADFYASSTTVTVGQSVTFYNSSTGNITSYSWNFGSGATPATANTVGPHTVVYNTTGYKTVSLTVSDGTNTDTETKTNYIYVKEPSTCDTLGFNVNDTLKLYLAQAGGYVSGNNYYGDLAKANFYNSFDNQKKITSVILWFGVAVGNNNTNIPVCVWKNDGSNGAPGTIISCVNTTIGTIKNDVQSQSPTVVSFSTPVTVSTPFYVGIKLPTTTGDTVALYAVDVQLNMAWEQWSDQVWYPYDHQDSWGISQKLAIYPIMCLPTFAENYAANNLIFVNPNPVISDFEIYAPKFNSSKVTIQITDLYGKLILNEEKTIENNKLHINIEYFKQGLYILKLKTNNEIFVLKITKV